MLLCRSRLQPLVIGVLVSSQYCSLSARSDLWPKHRPCIVLLCTNCCSVDVFPSPWSPAMAVMRWKSHTISSRLSDSAACLAPTTTLAPSKSLRSLFFPILMLQFEPQQAGFAQAFTLSVLWVAAMWLADQIFVFRRAAVPNKKSLPCANFSCRVLRRTQENKLC